MGVHYAVYSVFYERFGELMKNASNNRSLIVVVGVGTPWGSRIFASMLILSEEAGGQKTSPVSVNKQGKNANILKFLESSN